MRFSDRIATMMATIVIAIEMALVIMKLPEEKIAPIKGVIRVVPQVGHPAPRAISPVMMPAFSTLAEFEELASSRFLCQSKIMRPIRVLCKMVIRNVKSQLVKGMFMPKIPRNESRMILRLAGKPISPIISKLAAPDDKKFSSVPKMKNAGTKPYQKRFSLVANNIPLPAKTKPSNHFLQFI